MSSAKQFACFSLRKSGLALVPVFLLGMTDGGAAHVFSYFECEVDSATAFEDAITRVHEELAGGLRPTAFLDADMWNGSSENTHFLLLHYDSYRDWETVQGRIDDTPSAGLAIANAWEVADCDSDGLAIERGFWGDPETPWSFYAVLPITTSDPSRYAEAFGELAEFQSQNSSLAGVGLYEVRAGGNGENFVVAIGASSMAVLNENLDALSEYDEFSDFLDEVSDIRTVGAAVQRRRLRTWEP